MIATNPHLIKKNRSGRWLVLAMFVLAGAVVLLFYSATRNFNPAPKEATWGKPLRPMRVVAVDLSNPTSRVDPALAAQVDVIFIRGIAGRDVDLLAHALGMSQLPRAEVYYPGQNLDPEEKRGNAIFSRLPLYEGRSIPNKGGSFGVWAVAVVDGHKFMLASASLSSSPQNSGQERDMLRKAWEQLGSPPMIGGGDWAASSDHGVVTWGDWKISTRPTTAPSDSMILTCE